MNEIIFLLLTLSSLLLSLYSNLKHYKNENKKQKYTIIIITQILLIIVNIVWLIKTLYFYFKGQK